MLTKRKQIINELENLYVARYEDYKNFMGDGKFEEAEKAFNDCTDVLTKINEVNNKKLKAIDVAKLGLDGIVGLGSLGAFTYLGVKTFKFEETGTFSSTGGKNLASESFRRLSPPKV